MATNRENRATQSNPYQSVDYQLLYIDNISRYYDNTFGLNTFIKLSLDQ